MLQSTGLILSGWAECYENKPEAISKIEEGFDIMAGLGSSNFQYVTHVQAHIDGLMQMGRYEEAHELVNVALKMSEESGVKKNLPEVLRLKAGCEQKKSPADLENIKFS